ncbi:MAG: hypothetical protein IT426_19805 [Pirellulales bacterium]|nr:hypothetical protein [Pirellulales bacterium]
MNDDFIKRGGSAGAAIAFWMTLAVLFLAFLIKCSWLVDSIRDSKLSLGEKIGVMLIGFSCSMFVALPAAGVGYLMGKSAARCRSANMAFLQGAIFPGAILLGLSITFFLASVFQLDYSRSDLTNALGLFAIFTASSSLLFGLVAIYVRDYRQTGRKRPIPQFTLLEMLLVFTIIAVIISAITSIVVL